MSQTVSVRERKRHETWANSNPELRHGPNRECLRWMREGRDAAIRGQSEAANPYGGVDYTTDHVAAVYWSVGWRGGVRERDAARDR